MSESTKSSHSITKPNFLYSVISVALVLFLLGIFGLVVLHTSGLIHYLKENIGVIVELKDETSDSTITVFSTSLQDMDFVKPNSVSFTDKEQAALLMKEEFGDNFMDYDLENPLLDVVEFKVTADNATPTKLDSIRHDLLQDHEFIEEVTYEKILVENMTANIRKLGFLTFIICIVFIAIAIALINNTVKLSIYSNRFLIKNMQLVGATTQFISRPYIFKSIRNGILSGGVAIVLLISLILLIQQRMPELSTFRSDTSLIILMVGVLFSGILISSLSTYISVQRYLRMRMDDLY